MSSSFAPFDPISPRAISNVNNSETERSKQRPHGQTVPGIVISTKPNTCTVHVSDILPDYSEEIDSIDKRLDGRIVDIKCGQVGELDSTVKPDRV